METTMRSPHRTRWAMPLLCLFLGGLMFAAFSAGDDMTGAWQGLSVMALVAALVAFGGRSETIRSMREPDERASMLDLRATAIAGTAVTVVVLGSWLYEISQGGDGDPYGRIAAIGGLAYIVAIVFLRLRS